MEGEAFQNLVEGLNEEIKRGLADHLAANVIGSLN